MSWKKLLNENVTTASQLREYVTLPEADEAKLEDIVSRFPMSITRYYLSLVDWEHYETDPIFRLCVPSLHETNLSGSFDTSGESRLRDIWSF